MTTAPSSQQTQQPSSPKAQGSALLDEVHAFVTRFVSFSEPEQADAVTLWIVHTHAFAAAETTPRLAIQSAEKQSGKTRLLEILDMLVNEPLQTASISAAALFRIVGSEAGVTLLVDEVDSVFSARGKGREDLRGLLNAGYRFGSCVTRVCGAGVERFPVFAPVALAGIGRLPDTVQDRSIVIRLKRRAGGEEVAKLRRREADADAFTLKAAIARWAGTNVAALASALPDVPNELGDRAADVWEPLLAIADRCGAAWGHRAREAAVRLSARGVTDAGSESGTALLAAVRKAFAALGVERVKTVDLIAELAEVDLAKWGTLDPRHLARELKRYEIEPRCVRDGSAVFRGYLAADFDDAFGRYCA